MEFAVVPRGVFLLLGAGVLAIGGAAVALAIWPLWRGAGLSGAREGLAIAAAIVLLLVAAVLVFVGCMGMGEGIF